MKRYLFIIGTILMLIPFKVNALSGSISISCDSTTLTVGSTTTCTVSGYSDEEVSALTAKFSASGEISITNVSSSSIWQGNGSGGSFDLYTDENKSNNFPIGAFTVQASGNVGSGTITISGVSYGDASYNTNPISGTSITLTTKAVEIPSTNQNTPNNNQVVPDVPPITNNTSNNNVESKSNDATLKALTISNGTINFSSDVLEYNVEVSNDIDKITIDAIPNSDKASISIPEDLSLKLGNNNFEIKVTAEDGTELVYKLSVNRLDRVLSSNSKLKSLKIDGYKIDFNSDNYVYNLGDIDSRMLDIKVVPDDSKAKVKIYGNDNIGKNDAIVIKVTAEDKTSSEYIIYANNKSSNIKLSFIIPIVLFGISLIGNILLVIYVIKTKTRLVK